MFIMSTDLSDHLKKVHNKDLKPWMRIGKLEIIDDEDDNNNDNDDDKEEYSD